MTDLESIKATLTNISRGGNLLDTLIEFERTLSNLGIFAYKNWILGELVEGPNVGRYWYETVWMFPYTKMPDPDGALRLLEIGALVKMEEGTFEEPVRVNGPQDWVDPETKRAKMQKYRVWLVNIKLPMKYIERGLANTEEVMKKDIVNVDRELDSAYSGSQMVPESPDQMDAGALDLSAPSAGGMPDQEPAAGGTPI
jgi:hypothetical protein